jgi:hypothetical protein
MHFLCRGKLPLCKNYDCINLKANPLKGELMLKIILALSLISISSLAQAAGDPAMKADRESINSACAADGVTAHCVDANGKPEIVGTGLMKCIHAYHKATPSFKPSDACKSAMKKMGADKKAEGKK